MNILAIETSCDETAIAVIEAEVDRLTVRANVVSSQVSLHAQYGGVVPALAAREHTANIELVFQQAMTEARVQPDDIDLIAVTRGPGLGPALLVGILFARTLAWRWNKPLIGVNHLDGHIHSNWLPPGDMPTHNQFPALNLIVSGGHTELVLMRDHGDYEIIGETRDDAVGEAFDKVARLLDLGYPGGPKVSALAHEGNPEAFDFPRPMVHADNYDFSYSGLKTAVLYLIQELTGTTTPDKKPNLSDQQKRDIAASFQEAAIDVLIQKTAKTLADHQPKALFLSGGVSANGLLRSRLQELGDAHNLPVFIPDLSYTGDNAAMIAAAGYYLSQKEGRNKKTAPWEAVVMDPNLRLSKPVRNRDTDIDVKSSLM